MHKSGQISEECNKAVAAYVAISDVNDLKLRPIIAGPTCQTHRLSDFLDLILKPYTKTREKLLTGHHGLS